jgi:hypothetical protein
MATSNLRPLAVLQMKSLRKLGNFVEKARAIVLNMTNNAALFPSPTPALAIVTTHITALETAEDVAKLHSPGSVNARNLAYNQVLEDLHDLTGYVQSLADATENAESAMELIHSSGLTVKHKGMHVKPLLNVKSTGVSGNVELVARASAKREANEWQMSLDGLIWTNLPGTLEAKTTVTGLTPGTTIHFRHRPILKGTSPANWSQIVSLLIS